MTLDVPGFERETEHIALYRDDKYAWIDGEIISSDGGTWLLEAYKEVTNEYLVEHSTAKRTANQRENYAVGALARFNNNYEQLHPVAKEAAQAIGLAPVNHSPYMIPVAQVVEIAHAVEDSIVIIDKLLDRGVEPEPPAEPATLTGEGVGAAEVPRGILFHHYAIEDGRVSAANAIIPTGQNLQNIENDMRALVPQILDRSQDDITLALEMLVRAYDPCISCSTHLLDVQFE
jgi:coenzyme F420-reducing hydrogenase alpha subunit